jgi:hypothetical protein
MSCTASARNPSRFLGQTGHYWRCHPNIVDAGSLCNSPKSSRGTKPVSGRDYWDLWQQDHSTIIVVTSRSSEVTMSRHISRARSETSWYQLMSTYPRWTTVSCSSGCIQVGCSAQAFRHHCCIQARPSSQAAYPR